MQDIKSSERGNDMKNIQAYRHGDLAFVPVNSIPKWLEKATTEVMMTGSGGNDHIARNGDIYFTDVDDFTFGYLRVKEDTKIYHKEHGDRKVNGLMEAKLHVGSYKLVKQHEDTHEGMKPVVD